MVILGMVDDCFNHRAPVWGYADIPKKHPVEN
jgi:hypothetical protein